MFFIRTVLNMPRSKFLHLEFSLDHMPLGHIKKQFNHFPFYTGTPNVYDIFHLFIYF